MNGVGTRLKEIRKVRGVTQAEFARSLEVSQPALAAYEKGLREPPLSAIVALCLGFKVNPDWILLGEGVRYRGRESELISTAIEVTKRFLPEVLPDASIEQEAKFTSLIYQYLIENGEISPSMTSAIFKTVAA